MIHDCANNGCMENAIVESFTACEIKHTSYVVTLQDRVLAYRLGGLSESTLSFTYHATPESSNHPIPGSKAASPSKVYM